MVNDACLQWLGWLHNKHRWMCLSIKHRLAWSTLAWSAVPGHGFSTFTIVNKHGLMWLGGGGGWHSKRFPYIVAQRGWFSASTSWHYVCTISQATQQAWDGVDLVGTLAWSTYKLCPATVAQPQKLLNKSGVGVVGTLAWSTFKLYPATVAQL